MRPTPLRVGIVGTGEMRRPLVHRLQAFGHEVAAYARRPVVAAELAAAGIETVPSVPELGASREIVLIYVYSDDQVLEVAIGEGLVGSLAPGATLVIHTTGSPLTAETVAVAAAARGVAVVDAPASGGPDRVAAGTLTLFVGGADEHIGRCLPLFSCYASEVAPVGPVGSGQKAKLLNNLLLGAHVELAVQAAALSTSFGIDAGQFVATVQSCSGASYAISMLSRAGSAEALLMSAGRFLHKDVLVARAVAAELGASLGTFDAVTTPLLERTLAHG